MKKFLFLYFGGNPPATPEAGKATMDAWMAYFAKMGDKIVDGGAPLGPPNPLAAARAQNRAATRSSMLPVLSKR